MNEFEKEDTDNKDDREERPFREGIDYYFEDGLMVLTSRFLLERGYCCESGCRNCPYGFSKPLG
jgi:hypothetical protein